MSPRRKASMTPDVQAVGRALFESGMFFKPDTGGWKSEQAWSYMSHNVPEFLKALNTDGYFVISREELASQNERAYTSGHKEGWTARALLDA